MENPQNLKGHLASLRSHLHVQELKGPPSRHEAREHGHWQKLGEGRDCRELAQATWNWQKLEERRGCQELARPANKMAGMEGEKGLP